MPKIQTANGVLNVGAKIINLTVVEERVSRLEALITDSESALDVATLEIPSLLKRVKKLEAIISTLEKVNADYTEKLKILMKKS